ncbi:hypothetical protein KY319_02260 [Candidatus Woesearchaeota archaeon]|nr:hypothetical protein [Candidatus Woesearchaeota archaeon]
MVFVAFILGFFVKIVTGFDDVMTHVSVTASITRTRLGKVAFCIGILLAISLAIVVAVFFASILRHISYYRYISAGLLFLLSGLIFFGFFSKRKIERKLVKKVKFSSYRFVKLLITGFVASFATVIDDTVAYLPLFLGSFADGLFSVFGIICAALLEIFVIIFLSEKISGLPYKDEFASLGLALLGLLVLIGVL